MRYRKLHALSPPSAARCALCMSSSMQTANADRTFVNAAFADRVRRPRLQTAFADRVRRPKVCELCVRRPNNSRTQTGANADRTFANAAFANMFANADRTFANAALQTERLRTLRLQTERLLTLRCRPNVCDRCVRRPNNSRTQNEEFANADRTFANAAFANTFATQTERL